MSFSVCAVCVFDVWVAMHACITMWLLFAEEQVRVLMYVWMLFKKSLFFNITS